MGWQLWVRFIGHPQLGEEKSDGAEFGDIERAVRIQLKAQHVIDPDMGDHRARKLRVRGQEYSYQQAAIVSFYAHCALD